MGGGWEAVGRESEKKEAEGEWNEEHKDMRIEGRGGRGEGEGVEERLSERRV